MIDRNDMLELTRRLTPERSSVGRIAGAYFDAEGYVDGTFNINFLKLSVPERKKNLSIAKTVLFSETNSLLKEYTLTKEARRPGGLWQLLSAIKECGMKNDAYTDLFYEILGEKYRPDGPWSCFLFHGRYDVPVKGLDKAWMEGSEEVYEYLICAISPLTGDMSRESRSLAFYTRLLKSGAPP
ncbi:MAG: DUF4317 family protein [Clostridium sp.]